MSSETGSSRRGFLKGLAGAATAGVFGLSGCLRLPSGPGRGGPGSRGRRPPAPGEFAWQEPPQRSETVRHSSIGGSVQDAFDTISQDTELILDNGPYSETAELPSTDSITIAGAQGGTQWSNPGGARTILDSPSWSTETTSVQGRLQEGTTTLSVGDASIFAVGDDVHIQDPSDLYQGMGSSDLGTTHSQYKGELGVVSGVDRSNNTITLRRGTHQHYDNPNGELEASVIDWGLVDVHITGITFEGGVHSNWRPYSGDEMFGVKLTQTKNIWLDNLTANGFHGDLVVLGVGRNSYIRDCHVNDIGRYGISYESGHSHGRVQRITAGYIDQDESGYIMQCGAGASGNPSVPAPTYDIQAANCGPADRANWIYDAHFGAENVTYRGGVADNDDMGIAKLRGTDQHVSDGSYGPLPGWAVQSTQVIRNCSLTEITGRDGGYGWVLWPKEGHEVRNIRMADCRWINMDDDPFYFRSTNSGDPPPVRNLQVVNSSWNGEWIDDSMIRSCQGFDGSTVDFSTSSPPMTPTEYFSSGSGGGRGGGGAQNETA